MTNPLPTLTLKAAALRASDDPGTAGLIDAAIAEIERLRGAVQRQAAAVRTLHANEETEINQLRRKQQEWHQAVATLDSERQANAMLTAEVERLQRRERQSTKYWMRAAKEALAGDSRALHNRVAMHEAEPVDVVLSSLREEAALGDTK